MNDDVYLPESHPGYESLVTRHRIESGIAFREGVIAQGRGEASEYLLGEETAESANRGGA